VGRGARAVKAHPLYIHTYIQALCLEGVWGNGCIDPRFLDLGTSWRRVVSFTPRLLYPSERASGTHWIGDLVGPRVGLDDVKKILDPTGARTPTARAVQPVASRYTDCAIPAFPEDSTLHFIHFPRIIWVKKFRESWIQGDISICKVMSNEGAPTSNTVISTGTVERLWVAVLTGPTMAGQRVGASCYMSESRPRAYVFSSFTILITVDIGCYSYVTARFHGLQILPALRTQL
jgi:hypothetical protein